MTAADWIAERRALIAAATEGPWSHTYGPRELPRVWSDASGSEYELIAKCTMKTDVPDAALIADSRTSLPAALDALEVVLNSETRVVRMPLAVEQKAPAYSCDPCERGDHGNCPGRVHDISWQFDCACRKLVPHFEQVECYLVPVTAITNALTTTSADA